jgi:hypothetical protein
MPHEGPPAQLLRCSAGPVGQLGARRRTRAAGAVVGDVRAARDRAGVVGGSCGMHSQRPRVAALAGVAAGARRRGTTRPSRRCAWAGRSRRWPGGHIGMHSQRPAVAAVARGAARAGAARGAARADVGDGRAAVDAVGRGGGRGSAGRTRRRARRCCSAGPRPQPWSQRPPQPSSAPQAASGGQRGVQAQVPGRVAGLARVGAAPGQRPPQPSSAPQARRGAAGVAHAAAEDAAVVGAAGARRGHAQVSTHAPLTHTCPRRSVTRRRGFARTGRRRRTHPSAQVTPSQGARGHAL